MRIVGRLPVIVAGCVSLLSGFLFVDDAKAAGAGMPLGGFRFYPTLDVAANYDDNVYRTQVKNADLFFSETPGFTLQSGWSRNELDLFGWLAATQYASLTAENNTNWAIGSNGRLDIYKGLDFTLDASYSVGHDQRGQPNLSQLAESPTEFSSVHTNGQLSYHPYRFSLSVGGSYDRILYDPTLLIDGLPPLNNADRNYELYAGFVKGAYEFSPGYAGYVQINYQDQIYNLKFDSNGLERANDGYQAEVGVQMLVTNLIKGQVYVGYYEEKYHAPLVGVAGPDYGATLDYTLSDFWTFHLIAAHSLTPTTVAGASTENDQSVTFVVDYSVLRDVTIVGLASYLNDTLSGTSRVDQAIQGHLGLNYVLNSHAEVDLAYSYTHYASTLEGQGYSDHTVGLTLKLQQ